VNILKTHQALENGHHFGNLTNEKKIGDIRFSEYTLQSKPYMPPHFHREGYFSFLMEGQIDETINNHSYVRSPGMVVYHPPYTPHVNMLNSRKATLFHIEWTEAKKSILNQPENLRENQIIYDERIIKQLRSIYCDIKKNNNDHQIGNKVYDLYLSCEKSNCKKYFIKRPEWLDQLLAFINNNYDRSLTLDLLSEEVNKHPVHISRTFTKYMFCSVYSYITKLRIEAASSKIKKGQISLAKLAYDLGFSDQSHFSRTFKKYVNISPSSYQLMNESNS